MPADFDILLLGGGLHSCFTALAFKHARPEFKIGVIEAESTVGGNHVWSMHASDIPRSMPWLEDLIAYRWPRHEVRFPNSSRIIESGYLTLTSETLHRVVTKEFNDGDHQLLLEAQVVQAGPHEVLLSDGQRLRSTLVLDGRGLGSRPVQGCGFQKFYGAEFVVNQDHGFRHPILMDACVAQVDGFRFVYVLPFTDRRIFLEDTYFSEDSSLEKGVPRARLRDYASGVGLGIESLKREEFGVLPMPWTAQPRLMTGGPTAIGVRGGWYHPATAYSVPLALKVAEQATLCSTPGDFKHRLESMRSHHGAQARLRIGKTSQVS